ncbi:MAG: DUF262 domain-containing protein [Galbitalea sp.]
MDVSETRLRVVLGGDQRYRVPLYQRPYSWSEKQLERLWSDLLEIADELTRNETATHFTGSLVLDLGRAGPGMNEFLVVDGQQRLTSLSILLCAIRDHMREFDKSHPEKADEIQDRYLIDKYRRGDDRLKLLPTQADRDDYRALVEGAGAGTGSSRIATAYRFFRLQLQLADDPDDEHDIDNILRAALGALTFVSITARGDDNVYRIFESLNNTGMKLTQGDLLRNYIFMRLGTRGDEVYTNWWLPMQERLSAADLEALFWMDLVVENSEVNLGDIYSAQQSRLDHLNPDEVFDEVKRFARLAELLEVMRSIDESGRFGNNVRMRLQRLSSWGAAGADPLILRLLASTDRDQLTIGELEACLATLESFLIRRLLVRASSNALTRILWRAWSDMPKDMPVPAALMRYLSTGRKFFASDEQVTAAVLENPFYYMGRPQQRKLILQWLEDTYESKEPIDLARATIEHVLPQTLTPYWRDELLREADADETAEQIHEALEHTLGNLTLTAYNSELSNRDFPEKRELLRESGIRLNAAIADKPSWGRTEILERGRELASRIVLTWVAPEQTTDVVDSGATWALVGDAIAAIPAGSWTTYGDLAALAGTYPQPVAGFVTRTTIGGAWRVLQAGGTISPGFNWGSHSEYVGRDPREVLESEGVQFGSDGHADSSTRLSAFELAQRLGVTIDLDRETDIPMDEGENSGYERFVSQLTESQPAAVAHECST